MMITTYVKTLVEIKNKLAKLIPEKIYYLNVKTNEIDFQRDFHSFLRRVNYHPLIVFIILRNTHKMFMFSFQRQFDVIFKRMIRYLTSDF